ncbi:MAG: DUF262 and DUF1524 domain-containing protein [Pirellulaceae bacterium]|nr:DUF262 and DUF1524 domain-containing protein [Pirellulaceae bacterium]
MKATEAKLLDFLKKSPQFVIPIYQRTYSWTEKECLQLWDDIIRTGANDRISVHFVGSIVYIEKADSTVTTWEPLLVIDGQQRLTSVTLLIAALAKSLGANEPVDGFSANFLRGYYLQNPLEKGERKFKLLLSQTDKETLTAIVDCRDQPNANSVRITENFQLFEGLLKERGNDLATVCKGLAKLMMVDIKLKRGEDNPQLIFESMNSTGKRLSQADLIRNYILMGLESELQTQLYELYWRPMEVEFGQEAYGTHFDSFMRHYLTVKTGEIPRLDEVYEEFKVHANPLVATTSGVEALVKDIRGFSRHFCAMGLGVEPDTELKDAFHDLRELKVDVAYPFLLELYHDYKNGQLSKVDLLACVRLIESYVFRRAICAIPTNSMNKTFATFTKAVDKERYLESVQAQFLLLPSYRRFPTDDEFHRHIQTRDLYHFRSRSYWLRRLENQGRKERVPVDEYTIEHIMPQNENLSSDWRDSLGEDWKGVQKMWLHTLGNLTLTAYNPDFSDRPFLEKRDMKAAPEKGLRQSPLKLNQGFSTIEIWNEDAIKVRAIKLATEAVSVWTSPSMTGEVLDTYRRRPRAGTEYTIENHPNLLLPTICPVFEAFRNAVLGLDPCVTEEFLKLYVAYKAETNFVDVVPQVTRLRLSLNMPFADVNDPKGLCKDVTGKGRWGNGNVEVGLSKVEDLPYVIGLVRQSLELQMGNGGDA